MKTKKYENNMKTADFITKKVMWHVSALGTAAFMLVLAPAAFLAGHNILALQLLCGLALSFAVAFPLRMLFFKDRPK